MFRHCWDLLRQRPRPRSQPEHVKEKSLDKGTILVSTLSGKVSFSDLTISLIQVIKIVGTKFIIKQPFYNFRVWKKVAKQANKDDE